MEPVSGQRKVITVPTVEGDAEAVQERRGEPWAVSTPWTTTRFVGSAAEVRAFIRRNEKLNTADG